MRKGIPLKDWPDAALPETASILLATRVFNQFTGASLSCEEVLDMDPLIFDIIGALSEGISL